MLSSLFEIPEKNKNSPEESQDKFPFREVIFQHKIQQEGVKFITYSLPKDIGWLRNPNAVHVLVFYTVFWNAKQWNAG